MGEHTWRQPKLVMGYIEVVGPDGEDGIPYDEAVIHLEGDEDSEIEIHCPGALRLAPLIVKACNSHDALVKALHDIRGGSFDGASTFAVNGSWKLIVERLQKIAAEALAQVST